MPTFVTAYEYQKGQDQFVYYFHINDDLTFTVDVYKNGSKVQIRLHPTKKELLDKYSPFFPDLEENIDVALQRFTK